MNNISENKPDHKYVSLKELTEIVRANGITNRKAYYEFVQANTELNLPPQPDKYYPRKPQA